MYDFKSKVAKMIRGTAMKANETNLVGLLQGSKVFIVPVFQRRYSWRKQQWQPLWDDLLREYGQSRDGSYSQDLNGHFLGSIVLHPTHGQASILMRHQVIDGQQRLTTILVLLAAIRDVRKRIDPTYQKGEYDAYMVNPFDSDFPDRLVPTEMDRDAFVQTVRNSNPQGGIGQAYAFFVREIETLLTRDENFDLKKLSDTLLVRMLVVEVSTTIQDPVNNIFNSLNSKGVPLSAADLVRNELFVHLSEREASTAHAEFWQPMEGALVDTKENGIDDSRFVNFLWIREVISDPKVTKQSLFAAFESRLRQQIRQQDPRSRSSFTLKKFEEIFEDHKVFLYINDPSKPSEIKDKLPDDLEIRVTRLREWNSIPARPLTFWIVRAVLNGRMTTLEGTEALDILLGYLVRRTLVGTPTNQLNRLLTPIAHRLESAKEANIANLLRLTLSQDVYGWPSNDEVRQGVVNIPIYKKRNDAEFLLWVLENTYNSAEFVEDNHQITIERIVPQSFPNEGGKEDIEDAGDSITDVEPLLDTLGNLTLTSKNSERRDKRFAEKLEEFRRSNIGITRSLSEYEHFGSREILKRGNEFAEELLRIWPHQRCKITDDVTQNFTADDSAGKLEDVKDRVYNTLQRFPSGSWVTPEDLAKTLAIEDRTELRDALNNLPAPVARLVRNSDGSIPDLFSDTLKNAISKQPNDFDQENHLPIKNIAELIEEPLDSEEPLE